MAINNDEVKGIANLLWPDESAELTVKQKRIGPGAAPLNPTSVVCTNKRMVVINRSAFGLRKDYEMITYENIVNVRLERGIFSSSVILRLAGGQTGRGFLQEKKEEGEIDGLRFRDAKLLADFINRMVVIKENGAGHSYRYCLHCGTRNPKSATHCSSCGVKLE
jgi:hypothetical protein